MSDTKPPTASEVSRVMAELARRQKGRTTAKQREARSANLRAWHSKRLAPTVTPEKP